jgi:hypothetical protein
LHFAVWPENTLPCFEGHAREKKESATMRKIERIGEKKVMLDTDSDEMLYDSKTARTYRGGNSPTRGLDLYVHQ